jgi:hypothetical protein
LSVSEFINDALQCLAIKKYYVEHQKKLNSSKHRRFVTEILENLQKNKQLPGNSCTQNNQQRHLTCSAKSRNKNKNLEPVGLISMLKITEWLNKTSFGGCVLYFGASLLIGTLVYVSYLHMLPARKDFPSRMLPSADDQFIMPTKILS